MTAAPLVSCIVIFKDAAEFMEEALASVYDQSWARWELLLVDDGSLDASSAIAQRHATRDPERVRYLEHPGHTNLGMSASRNLGLAHARGAYVAFLDADDVWLRHKLSMQVGILEAHPGVDMVYGPSEYWYGWTGNASDARRDHFGDLGVPPDTILEPPELLVRSLENDGGTMPGICSLLVRRAVIERVGGFEPAFRGAYEDQVFLSKIFLRARVFVTGTCSDRYRQHENSSCAQAVRAGEYHPELPHPARRRFLRWLREYLEVAGMTADARLAAALRRTLLPYDHPLVHGSRARLRYLWRRARRELHPVLRAALPGPAYRWLRARWHAGEWVPPVGLVRFGSLRRRAPVSVHPSRERGQPVDRFYVDAFLRREASCVRGRVLEIGDAEHTALLADPSMSSREVLAVEDLGPARREDLTADAYDCIVAPQVLQRTYDVAATLAALYRALKPGGVVLATVPGAGSIGAPEVDATYWGFTALSTRSLFEEVFPAQKVVVDSHGNVLAATALLHGIAARELRPHEIAHHDGDYPVVLTVRAEKPTPEWLGNMLGRWRYANAAPFPCGDDVTYRKGMAHLDGHGAIEDWGAGTGYARRFVTRSDYRAVDGSPSLDVDCVTDLRHYRSEVDCVFMRHVLEHNLDWEPILLNALASFRRRMVLILFTPFASRTQEIGSWSGIPDVAFRKQDLLRHFAGLHVREESVVTHSQYRHEHVFYLERRAVLRRSA
jgi:glycosyltransferase involved in cell wall biosynthesis/SAM-dependent methyltransferase